MFSGDAGLLIPSVAPIRALIGLLCSARCQPWLPKDRRERRHSEQRGDLIKTELHRIG